MELTTCAANTLSRLCVRVSTAEKRAGITGPIVKPAFNAIPLNSFEKVNVLCQRIKRLERKLGIPFNIVANNQFKPLGPNGNAVVSNKLNRLCGRLGRIEKRLQ